MSVLERVLPLAAGVAAAILSLTLLLIARFYERSGGGRSNYRLFLLPAGLLVLAGAFSADPGSRAGAALWLAGGGSLLLLCLRLYQRMTRRG